MVSTCCFDPVNCDGGLSDGCDYECGRVFIPFLDQCGDILQALGAYDEDQALLYESHAVRCLQLDPKTMVLSLHNSVCQLCGDGEISGSEECDDGDGVNSQEPNAHCRTNCLEQRCGDGIVDDGEQCDDGLLNAAEGEVVTEGCTAACLLPHDCGTTQDTPAQSCADIHANCANLPSGMFWLDPNGGDAADAFQVYCDMENDGGGWTLVATVSHPFILPFMDLYLTDEPWAPEPRDQRRMHSQFRQILGTDIRVGRMVGTGSATGDVLQINDCGSDDAACIHSEHIGQNDGDEFGHWVLHGASYWNSIPGGCGNDGCPATDGDRDHDASLRIAIWGGDCYSGCGTNQRNGFQYTRANGNTDANTYGVSRWFWSVGTETSGSTQLGPQQGGVSCNVNSPADCPFDSGLSRNVWIK